MVGRARMAARMAAAKSVPQYSGEGSITKWLRTMYNMCRINGVTEEIDIVYVIASSLTGNASAVYDELPPEQKTNKTAIERKLLKAYQVDKFMAWSRMANMTIRPGQGVDDYMVEIRTMFKLHEDIESMMLGCFLKGLPSHVSQPIQQQATMGHVSMEAAVDLARASMASDRENQCAAVAVSGARTASDQENQCAAVAVGGARNGPGVRRAAEKTRYREERGPLRCYGCDEEGHIARRCPRVECFKCHKKGHRAAACPENGQRE